MTTIVLVCGVVLVSVFVRAALGFGDALVAMPLLLLFLPLETAVPLVGAMGLIVSFAILARNWRTIDVDAAWRLVIASLVGVPVGLFALQAVPAAAITRGLGILLIFYGSYSLAAPPLPVIGPRWAIVFGFVSGVLGGAYNINGPPIVLYGTLRRWSPQRFRATFQGCTLFTSTLIVAGHAVTGLWTPDVLRLAAPTLPAVGLGVVLGTLLHQRIPADRFRQIIMAALVVIGVVFVL